MAERAEYYPLADEAAMAKLRDQPPHESQPLLQSAAPASPASAVAGFDYGERRETQDRVWSFVLLVVFVANVALGVHGVQNSNPRYRDAFESTFLQDSANCPAEPHARRLIETQEPTIDPHAFGKVAGGFLAATAVAGVLVGVLVIHRAKTNAHQMLNFAVGAQVALPAFATAACLMAGNAPGAAVFGLYTLLMAWLMHRWRDFFDLCARLISVAATALASNPHLVTFSLALKAGAVLFFVPMVALLFVSVTNGHIVPNPAVAGGSGTSCVDAEGNDTLCCAWQVDPWVNGYLALGSLFLLWTSMIVFEIRTFVVAGCTTQWYYAPVGTAASANNGALKRSVGHAFGPQFGSLAYGGLVLAWAQILRDMADRMQRERNIFSVLLGCILACLADLIAFLTKFATIRAAITGEAFCDAGRQSTDLLKRNFLPTVGVWYFPPMILGMTSFIVSAVWGMAVFLMARGAFHGAEPNVLLAEAIVLGVLAFVLMLTIVSFFCNLLLSVIDTVYYCFATDKDRSAVTIVEVHDVFNAVPAVASAPGPVIANPDGNMGYGRVDDQEQGMAR